MKWAESHVDLSIDEDDEFVARAQREDYENRAYAYSAFAVDAARRPSIVLYRMICVPSAQDIQLHNLGKAWSKTPRGAGCYGMSHHPRDKARDILVEAEVRTKDIDWAYGFTSFMYYGEDQWEVSVNPNAPVLVRAINGKRYDPPLKGNTGRARETWETLAR